MDEGKPVLITKMLFPKHNLDQAELLKDQVTSQRIQGGSICPVEFSHGPHVNFALLLTLKLAGSLQAEASLWVCVACLS